MTSAQPSTRTKNTSLNGSATATGGSIIMPIDIRIAATDEVDDEERHEQQEPDLERASEFGHHEGGDERRQRRRLRALGPALAREVDEQPQILLPDMAQHEAAERHDPALEGRPRLERPRRQAGATPAS